MRPFVDFVRIAGHDGEEPHMPCQAAKQRGSQHQQAHREQQIPVALPPVLLCHVARQMMMQCVRAAKRAPHERRVFTDVGVFDPMDDAGNEVGGKNNGEDLDEQGE